MSDRSIFDAKDSRREAVITHDGAEFVATVAGESFFTPPVLIASPTTPRRLARLLGCSSWLSASTVATGALQTPSRNAGVAAHTILLTGTPS